MMAVVSDGSFFTRSLVSWHRDENSRSLPWKEEKDPYKIWLSEILLQQTRAAQVIPYYHAFTDAYPDICALAGAADEDVFRIWQGLGYYNRCRNMLATARYICHERGGLFPSEYDDILALKGVGAYTAAAIASFAFDLPYAVVDGNVYRILSRYRGIDTPYDTTEGRKLFAALATELLDKKNSAGYNQAIMDLGATVCTPAAPLCKECPLSARCYAFQRGATSEFPVKSKKLVVRPRYFNYLLLRFSDEIWIRKRAGGDIWADLHEPYLIETESPVEVSELVSDKFFKINDLGISNVIHSGSFRQRLTHQLIHSNFYIMDFDKRAEVPGNDGMWIRVSQINKLAFPKTVLSFLRNNLYF